MVPSFDPHIPPSISGVPRLRIMIHGIFSNKWCTALYSNFETMTETTSTKECKYASIMIMKSTRKCCSPMFTISFTTTRTNSNDVVFTSCEHVICMFSQWYIPVFSGIWKCVKTIQKLSIWTHTSQGMNINVQAFTSILSSIYIHTSQLFWCTHGDSFGWRQSPFFEWQESEAEVQKGRFFAPRISPAPHLVEWL